MQGEAVPVGKCTGPAPGRKPRPLQFCL